MAELIRGTEKTKQIPSGVEYDPRFEKDPDMAVAMAALSSKYRNRPVYDPNLSGAQNAAMRASSHDEYMKAAEGLMKTYLAGNKDIAGKKILADADLEGKKIVADASVRGQRIGANAHEQVARITANSNAEQMAAMMGMGGGSGALRERAAMADKVDLILNAMAAKSAAEKKSGGLSGFLSEIFSGKSGYE